VVSKDEVFNTLKMLSEAVGASGYEFEVRDLVIDMLKDYADELRTDPLGNVIAVKKGSRGSGKVMIAAHMDEIALVVSHIDKKGFIKVRPVGGWNSIVLPGQRVLVVNDEGKKFRGVVGIKPPHIMKPEEAKQVPEIKDLFIDLGVRSKEGVEKLGITVGSIVVPERTVERLANPDIASGKAFDDRVGVTALIHAFREAPEIEPSFYAVITVQEEVGLKGARTVAYSISPDVALAIDVTIAADVPGTDEAEKVVELGKGPAIKIIDGRNASGLIAHPEVRKLLVRAAKEEGIPYQLEVLPSGTTDATIIALNKEGVPTGAVSIPTRYVHSPVEVISLIDVVNTVKLINAFLKRVSNDWLMKIKGVKIK